MLVLVLRKEDTANAAPSKAAFRVSWGLGRLGRQWEMTCPVGRQWHSILFFLKRKPPELFEVLEVGPVRFPMVTRLQAVSWSAMASGNVFCNLFHGGRSFTIALRDVFRHFSGRRLFEPAFTWNKPKIAQKVI